MGSTLNGHAAAAAYLARLPAGIDSYPEAQVVGVAYESLPRLMPDLAKEAGLPAPVHAVLSGEGRPEWVNEVVGNTALLMVRERFESDDAFLAFYDEHVGGPTFNRPLYRAMLFVFSPALAVMGSAKRWGALHRGTTLVPHPVVEDGPNRSARLVLTTQARLFDDELLRRRLGRAFFYVLAKSGGKNPAINVSQADPTTITFDLSWRG